MSTRHLFNNLFLLFICLQISSPTNAAANCRPQDRSALLAFRNTLVKSRLQPTFSCSFLEWDESADCCSWDGITCQPSTGTVIGISYLPLCDGTSATFASNASLFQLSSLQSLDLSSLNLQKSVIPSEIEKLSQLRTLILDSANLSGPIPNAVGRLIQLQTLSLADNNMWGSIPLFIPNLKNLRSLRLNGNSFTGTIPAGLFSHPHLSELELSFNKLQGPLPPPGSSHFTVLHLDNNMLNGTIPSWLFFMDSLLDLDLSSNEFTALQPFHKPETSSLTMLDLGFNNIAGPIPSSLLQLVKLKSLRLDGNQFAGAVEWNSFKNMVNLSTLALYANTGLSLKHTVGSPANLPLLTNIYMGWCGLTEFPEFLSVLEGLDTLEVMDNKISGACFQQSGWVRLGFFFGGGNQITAFKFPNTIISQFDLGHNLISGNLPELPTSLVLLYMENNQLSGRIPSLNMGSLGYLNLSYNHFEGPIPPTGFSNESFFGNPGLCGPPLSKSCRDR